MALDPEQLLQITLGGLTLERFIGHGTFAWVYLAREISTGNSVAVKVLAPSFAGEPQFEARFRNEAETASSLEHPNIVRIRQVGSETGLTYLTMDYYPDSLANHVREDGKGPTEGFLIRVADEIASALDFAHVAGVVHRDIKPDNILLADDGRAVLADFGIAKAASGLVNETGANMTIGTPHYLSPEQAQGMKIDGRSDLYSLGVTLYRAATGALPFRSTDWFELARMHVEDPPIKPTEKRPDLSGQLEQIILKLLAKLPEQRYATANDLKDEIARVRTSMTGRSSDPYATIQV